jgi:hypothetical protein
MAQGWMRILRARYRIAPARGAASRINVAGLDEAVSFRASLASHAPAPALKFASVLDYAVEDIQRALKNEQER